MGAFSVLIVLTFIVAISVNEVLADCVEEDHIYECRAPDEEAEDLTCSECYSDGENGHYNCSCWTNPPELEEELDGAIYLNCQDAYMHGETENGAYTLKPDHLPSFKAFCNMESEGGGWTVIQRRIDGSVNFYLGWAEYIHGFGNVSGEYWLGLSKIHRLANSSMPLQLRVDLESFARQTRYAVYSSFYIGGPSTDYQLHVTGYSGNAQDGMTYNNGMKFSTKDNDNDKWGSDCAVARQSGWWHNACTYANINGQYFANEQSSSKSNYWYKWLSHQSLKNTMMMIRANND